MRPAMDANKKYLRKKQPRKFCKVHKQAKEGWI